MRATFANLLCALAVAAVYTVSWGAVGPRPAYADHGAGIEAIARWHGGAPALSPVAHELAASIDDDNADDDADKGALGFDVLPANAPSIAAAGGGRVVASTSSGDSFDVYVVIHASRAPPS